MYLYGTFDFFSQYAHHTHSLYAAMGFIPNDKQENLSFRNSVTQDLPTAVEKLKPSVQFFSDLTESRKRISGPNGTGASASNSADVLRSLKQTQKGIVQI